MAKASSDNNGTLWGDLVQALRRCEGERRVSQGTYRLIETANVPTGRSWWTQVQGAQTIDVVPKILQYGLALCGHGCLLLWCRATRMPQGPGCVHCFLADRCILPLKRCHGFCHGALQLGHTRATALREPGFATTAAAKLCTHVLEQYIGLHWQLSRPRADQAYHLTGTRCQQCQDTLVCHEPMRQEFDVVEVTVVKDTQDDPRRGRHRRGGEEFLGFGLGCQFDERTGTPFKFFVLFQEPCHCLQCFIA